MKNHEAERFTTITQNISNNWAHCDAAIFTYITNSVRIDLQCEFKQLPIFFCIFFFYSFLLHLLLLLLSYALIHCILCGESNQIEQQTPWMVDVIIFAWFAGQCVTVHLIAFVGVISMQTVNEMHPNYHKLIVLHQNETKVVIMTLSQSQYHFLVLISLFTHIRKHMRCVLFLIHKYKNIFLFSFVCFIFLVFCSPFHHNSWERSFYIWINFANNRMRLKIEYFIDLNTFSVSHTSVLSSSSAEMAMKRYTFDWKLMTM